MLLLWGLLWRKPCSWGHLPQVYSQCSSTTCMTIFSQDSSQVSLAPTGLAKNAGEQHPLDPIVIPAWQDHDSHHLLCPLVAHHKHLELTLHSPLGVLFIGLIFCNHAPGLLWPKRSARWLRLYMWLRLLALRISQSRDFHILPEILSFGWNQATQAEEFLYVLWKQVSSFSYSQNRDFDF